MSNLTPQRDDLVQKSGHKPRFWFVDYLGLLIAVPLLILPPLTYLELDANQWREGFIPIIMINAEMKFCVIVIFGSLLTALMGLKVYFLGKTHYLPKLLVLSGGAFLLAVFLSTLFAHNLERAWISSFLWHLLPLGIGLACINIDWTRNKILFFLSLSVLAGTLSSLVALDQHYYWTDWSQRFPRTVNPAGIIFNHNFAAEYHAPLIPICLGIVLWIKNLYIRGIFILTMALIFFPVVALSLARGAWVGLIGGCLSTCFFFVVFMRFHRKTLKVNRRKAYFYLIPFIALACTLPLYLMTSGFWKHSKSNLQTSDKPNRELVEFESIFTDDPSNTGKTRRIELWTDTLRTLWSKHLLIGRGSDHYEMHFHESAKIADKTTGKKLVRYVHNDFLQILYENGLLGLLGFLGLWGGAIYLGLRSALLRASASEWKAMGLQLSLIACLLTFLIEALFEFPTKSPCALLVGWTTWGVSIAFSLKDQKYNFQAEKRKLFLGPVGKLVVGSIGVALVPLSTVMAKDLFWGNLYYYQAKRASDLGDHVKSLSFHRKSIQHTPWHHRSRKWECFFLLTRKKDYQAALESAEEAIRVHPGCLNAHQYRIGVLFKNLNRKQEAKDAFLDMNRSAPYHPYTHRESLKFYPKATR